MRLLAFLLITGLIMPVQTRGGFRTARGQLRDSSRTHARPDVPDAKDVAAIRIRGGQSGVLKLPDAELEQRGQIEAVLSWLRGVAWSSKPVDTRRANLPRQVRPEIAIIRLRLAELLFEHFPEEQPEALIHLDFAIEEFRAMKMQPSLERALRHKGLLHA